MEIEKTPNDIIPIDFLNTIEMDLKDLYDNDEITSAKKLNKELNTEIATKQKPMYFTGKFDAKTVLVMLNPGSTINKDYSFTEKDKSQHSDFNHFFKEYINFHINYGKIDAKRQDNFDLKQAAFLYDFKNSELKIPDFFKNDNEKLKAKENVLMNKLQLELIPYCSANFFELKSLKQAKNNINVFLPHIERLLNAIVSYDRKYVVFCSNQFYLLFKACGEKTQVNIKFIVEQKKVDIGVSKKASFSIVEITHKGKVFKAIIANTFPRQDLPNAYDKMRNYGKLCWNEFMNE